MNSVALRLHRSGKGALMAMLQAWPNPDWWAGDISVFGAVLQAAGRIIRRSIIDQDGVTGMIRTFQRLQAAFGSMFQIPVDDDDSDARLVHIKVSK
jgi:hypothetical protein